MGCHFLLQGIFPTQGLPELGAAALAALRGGWDPASLGEVGENKSAIRTVME